MGFFLISGFNGDISTVLTISWWVTTTQQGKYTHGIFSKLLSPRG